MSDKKNFDIIEAIKEWSINFNLPVLDNNEFPSRERILLSFNLIEEEKEELWEAIQKKDFKETQDALGDLFWVTVRAMMEFGIDPYKTIEAIYISNMSKLDNTLEDALTTKHEYLKKGIETYYEINNDGKYVTHRVSDGKVQKSYRFKEPVFKN
jgi:NTP pyrophosphatase (non-canonical NTP hydrolase)